MSLIAGDLGVVQRLLDSTCTWAVCAGAAAHLYGNRRPLVDVDLLVERGTIANVVQTLRAANKTVQSDSRRVIWHSIKIFDDLSVARNGATYPFALDAAMQAHLQQMPLLGVPAHVLAPEDVLVHKLVLDRGSDEGKHDLDDAAGIIRRQTLDVAYLNERLRLMRAPAAIHDKLASLGVVLA